MFGAGSGEFHDFNEGADVAGGGTSNHDHAVTAGKTALLSSVITAASGAAKWELKTGPLATLATRAVWFTTVAEPSEHVRFEPAIEVPDTNTGTIRLVRTNREPLAQRLCSTRVGREV